MGNKTEESLLQQTRIDEFEIERRKELYLSSLATLRQLMHGAIEAHVPETAGATQVKDAIDKLLYFDTAMVFDAYIRGMLAEIETAKEVAVRYARSLEAKVAERTRELELISRHDALTGVFNRRAFDEALRLEITRAKRAGTPLALLYVDIDDFKAVNDARGHQQGDEALRLVAGVLKEISRESDIVARLGGDEFCVVLPGVDQEGANEYCTRLVETLRERDASLGVSIGVGRTGPVEFEEPEKLLHAADMRMYQDKARHHGGHDHAMADRAVS